MIFPLVGQCPSQTPHLIFSCIVHLACACDTIFLKHRRYAPRRTEPPSMLLRILYNSRLNPPIVNPEAAIGAPAGNVHSHPSPQQRELANRSLTALRAFLRPGFLRDLISYILAVSSIESINVSKSPASIHFQIFRLAGITNPIKTRFTLTRQRDEKPPYRTSYKLVRHGGFITNGG